MDAIALMPLLFLIAVFILVGIKVIHEDLRDIVKAIRERKE